MWETIRGYLTFTKRERYGVLFLFILITLLFISPYFFKKPSGTIDVNVDQKYVEGVERLENMNNDSQTAKSGSRIYYSEKLSPENRTQNIFQGGLFLFDPNTISYNDWKKLGLRDRLIEVIIHFLSKGGHFYKAEDLEKIYGLRKLEYQRLLPYIRIKKSPDNYNERHHKQIFFEKGNVPGDSIHFLPVKNQLYYRFYDQKKLVPTDINKSDSADWCKLPGIGPKLGSRIVHFREKLGGFYFIDQVGETFGLPDSTFQKIKGCLLLNNVVLQKIDLNKAAQEQLISHPYIRWQISKAILNYRIQHGGFNSVEEVQQLLQMDGEKFRKLRPYLVVN